MTIFKTTRFSGTTIIGFEVRPLRVDFAIHEKNLLLHRFKTDGMIQIPSSLVHSQADHQTVLYDNLSRLFGAYQEDTYDLALYAGEDRIRKEGFREELRTSMLWINRGLQQFFEQEITGINFEGDADKKFRRKALRDLEVSLEGYKYSYLHANWIAFEGAKDVEEV